MVEHRTELDKAAGVVIFDSGTGKTTLFGRRPQRHHSRRSAYWSAPLRAVRRGQAHADC